MATPIRVPALAQTSDELRLTAWLKTEGEQVTEGEPLFEAETDKAELEVEATASGTLLRCLARPGETVSIGTVVAWIGQPGEDIPQAVPGVPDAAATARRVPATVSPSPGVASPASVSATDSSSRLPATPAARALARERGIDLAQVTGSGPGGRIERRDVLAALDSASPRRADDGTTDVVPPHRRAIAARLSRAATVPQFTVSRTVDARSALARAAGLDGVTLTHVLLQAAAVALRAMPNVNRVWLDEGPRFLRLAHCHVGLAIAAAAVSPETDTLDALVEPGYHVWIERKGGVAETRRYVAGSTPGAAEQHLSWGPER